MADDWDGMPDEDIWNIDYNELQFVKEIARGSFGKVFRGTYLGVDVAIKQILRHNDPAYMKYIEREISVLNVTLPHDAEIEQIKQKVSQIVGDGLYIVTEFVDGGDVRSLLKTGKVSWFKRVQIASDLAKAMYYLHSKKIIHRDLKSKNLLLGSDGRLRLCDFGFARITDFRTQRAMTICGTPGFVAPEIMLGTDYDASCDSFSFGNVIAELITLQRPGKDFWNRNAEDGYKLNLDELRKIAPKDCPKVFLELCLQCCNYDPTQRPDFGYILQVIKQIESELPRDDAPSYVSAAPSTPAAVHASVNASVQVEERNGSSRPAQPVAPSDFRVNEESYIQSISQQKLKLSSGEQVLSEKHFNKMVVRAVNPDFYDSEYVQDLLLCYPTFATPHDLLNIIIEKYTSTALESFTVTGKDFESAGKKQQLTGIRIIVFLNTWIEKYPEDFREPKMAELISAFDVLATSSSNEKEAYSIEATLAKSLAKKTPKLPIKISGEKKSLDTALLLNTPALELARQLTYIDYHLFRTVKGREYLKEIWKRRPDSGISILMQRHKELSRWVATAIVKTEHKETRSTLIAKFIEVAQQCLTLKNYHSFFGIINGLHHGSIERLTQTWQGVKPAAMNTWKSFQPLVSKAEHYSNYKSKQEKSVAPSVPFIDVYTEEIAYIDSFNPDIGKGGIINFSKHRKISRIIRTLETYQTVPFNDIHPIDSIQNLLLNSIVFDDDNLQKKSLNCEKPSGFG